MSNKIGDLKIGFLADIIAVDENVDTDIHAILNVHFVMKDGVVYMNK
jgi:imidazolonepropionase-like amidohydrolase